MAELKSFGYDAERHAKNYIDPFVTEDNTHEINVSHEDLPAKTKVSVRGWYKDEAGKHFANCEFEGKRYDIPFSRITKPTKKNNKGLSYETKIVQYLNGHGLMDGSGAGCTDGNDIHLINKSKQSVHQGEVKLNLKATFGQVSCNYANGYGWHFSDKAEMRFPKYVQACKEAVVTIEGSPRPLMEHINAVFDPPNRDVQDPTNVYSDPVPLQPANRYLYDHHVEILHVGSHGTFRAGRAEEEDPTGIGLETPDGTGQFRARRKHPNSVTIQFIVRNMNKSKINLEDENDILKIKGALGHE